MSALAQFIRLPVTSVEQLRDHYDEVVEREGVQASEYYWSGYVLATVLPYLAEQGIDLTRSPFDALTRSLSAEHDASIYIFTPSHKDAFLSRLLPSLFSNDTLRDYFNEFNQTAETDIGEAMLDGITCIYESLISLDDDSVILFSIG
ncbi:hypothetical protein BH09VER1_BH09VER1_01620 [soil metagenome]